MSKYNYYSRTACIYGLSDFEGMILDYHALNYHSKYVPNLHLNINQEGNLIRRQKTKFYIDDRFISNLTIESNAAFDIIINAQTMQ